MDELYIQSVNHILDMNWQIHPLAMAFRNLPYELSAISPHDAAALLSVDLTTNSAYDRDVTVLLLAINGFSPGESIRFCEQLLHSFPQFDANTAMLMTEQMLVDTYGVLNGRTVSEALLDSQRQPIIHTLLFNPPPPGEVVVIDRGCSELTLRGTCTLPREPDGTQQAHVGKWSVIREKNIDMNRASYLVHQYNAPLLSSAQITSPLLPYRESTNDQDQS